MALGKRIKTESVSVKLKFAEFDGNVDVEQVTQTHYENLRGEEAETTRILNGLTQLKAEVEDVYERSQLETKRVEAKVKRDLRVEAANNSGKVDVDGTKVKLTEEALKELARLNKEFYKAATDEFNAKKDFDLVSGIYWQVKSKMDRINHIFAVSKTNYYENQEDYNG